MTYTLVSVLEEEVPQNGTNRAGNGKALFRTLQEILEQCAERVKGIQHLPLEERLAKAMHVIEAVGGMVIRNNRPALMNQAERYLAGTEPYAKTGNRKRVRAYVEQTLNCMHKARKKKGLVEKAIEYLHAHYTERGIGLDTVANAVSVSREHMAREFRKEMGMTIIEYMQRLRITDALMRLSRNSDALKPIAYELGYGTYNDFSRNFLKQVGMQPRSVKESMQETGIPGVIAVKASEKKKVVPYRAVGGL
ncbi:helix-turn-helix transcriptional regulator [Candidatus Woesearchaeota archaeon]|nr:helix-turn-helix transcriptional regulator [Candidatus Woesearchaeota archaeon]